METAARRNVSLSGLITRPIEPATGYGIAFCCAAIAFCLKSLFAPWLGIAAAIFAVIGNATCGWSWLATRSLFRPDGENLSRWPLAAVLLVMVSAALAALMPADDILFRVLDNLARLGSSAMLLLAFAEPLRGLRDQQDGRERRFRIVYAAGYVAILAVAVLAVDGAPKDSIAAQLGTPIKAACAIAAVFGYGLALRHRRRYPLAQAQTRPKRKAVTPDTALGDRLIRLLTDDQLYTQPDLRVADLARHVGEPEYKVTQCITGTLGFPNFNQMVNRCRIDEAKRRLADPAFAHLPILTIALDCGFGSIGPFNRAFKADTGTTPQAYRRNPDPATILAAPSHGSPSATGG